MYLYHSVRYSFQNSKTDDACLVFYPLFPLAFFSSFFFLSPHFHSLKIIPPRKKVNQTRQQQLLFNEQ